MSHSPPHEAARRAGVTRWQDGQLQSQPDWLAEELPVALVFNGISHAVMMASPSDLEDFALGFALTEGLIAQAADLYGIEVEPAEHGLALHLTVSSRCFAALKVRRRSLTGRTGCGLCGTDSLDQVCRSLPPLPPVSVRPAALALAQRSLHHWQTLQQHTGASHAAAWCAADSGQLLLLREDVGRHNALDKLIGALHRQPAQDPPPLPPHQGFILLTSRASFEMVQKTAMAGVGLLAAVSAPTALAVRTASAAGLALAGFVRGDNFVAYTHPERFGLGTPAKASPPADSPTCAAHGH